MATIQKGATAYCIFEHRIKPFDVQVAKIVDVRPSRGFGLTEVELDNGIVFKGSNSKSQFLYEDKDRIPGAPAKPTRAQVVIFVDYNLAVRHLSNRSAAKLIPLLKPVEKKEAEDIPPSEIITDAPQEKAEAKDATESETPTETQQANEETEGPSQPETIDAQNEEKEVRHEQPTLL